MLGFPERVIFGSRYLRRQIFPEADIPGGDYFLRRIFQEADIFGGDYSWRQLFWGQRYEKLQFGTDDLHDPTGRGTERLRNRTTVQPHCCTPPLLYNRTTMQPYYYATSLLHNPTTIHCTTMQPHCCAILRLHDSVYVKYRLVRAILY